MGLGNPRVKNLNTFWLVHDSPSTTARSSANNDRLTTLNWLKIQSSPNGKPWVSTKRCNQTGRTVIGPDPTLELGQLAVPPAMADILTIPVRVASFNIDILQKLVDNGRVNSLLKPDGKTRINLKRFRRGTRLLAGDVIYRGDIEIPVVDGRELVEEGDKVKRAGKFLERLAPANRSYRLKLGWIAERKLQDGDYVLLNRQPTLHRGSMMAMQVVVRKGKTLRMNLACTKSFNADFDKISVKNRGREKRATP